MTETFSVLIAIGIVMIFVVICVLCSMYLMKNKIYQSNDELTLNEKDVNKLLNCIKEQEKIDEHLDKLLSNEKAYDLNNLTKEDKKTLVQGLYDSEKLLELKLQARDRYLKSNKTIKISEIAEVFNNKYPKMSDINVKYAIMKLVTISETKEKRPIVLKKVGKTFHIRIKDLLVMRHCIRYVPRNQDIKYNIVVMNDIFDIALDLLTKKIVPEKDKYLWKNNLNDSVDKW